MDQKNQVYKALLIGDQGVGKSSILLNYTTGEFKSEYTVTIGLEFGSKAIQLDKDTNVTLQIWDTAGQEAFKSIIRSFYRNAAAVFIVYNVTKRETFDNINEWVKEVRNHSHKDVILVLLGNKSDLEQLRQVGREEGEQKKNEIVADLFFEVSGKTGLNLQEAFKETTKLVNERYHQNYSFKRSIAEEEENPNMRRSLIRRTAEDQDQEQKKKDKSGCC